MKAPAVDVALALNQRGKDVYAVKLSGPCYEVNIEVPTHQIGKLEKVFATSWDTGSLRIGRSAGASVFWSCNKKTVSILIGHDDETWDLGIFVPLETLKKIIREIQNCPEA